MLQYGTSPAGDELNVVCELSLLLFPESHLLGNSLGNCPRYQNLGNF